MVSIFYHKASDTNDWSFARQRPMSLPGDLDYSLKLIKENHISSKDESKPTLYFLDDDLLRAPELRQDYEFPYLH